MEHAEESDIYIDDVAQLPYTLDKSSRREISFQRYDIHDNEIKVENIVYYNGVLQIKGKDGHKTEKEKVTFVCFKERAEADKVCQLSRRITHPRVLRASFCTFSTILKEHLVCFDKFDGFLMQSDERFLEYLKHPRLGSEEISKNPNAVPDNPNMVVQQEIEGLTDALIHLHSKEYSTSWLNIDGGYVWSEGKLKIFMVDCFEKGHTNEEWVKIKVDNVLLFRRGLLKYFLDSSDNLWPSRDSFLKCFRVDIRLEDKRLWMIKNHPFLKVHVKTALQFMSEVQHGLISKEYGELNLGPLNYALQQRDLDKYFIVNGRWSRGLSVTFQKIKRKSSYDETSIQHLLRFIRNIYRHHHKSSRLGLTTAFNEIQSNWPYLIDYIHEYVYGRHAQLHKRHKRKRRR